MLKAKQVWMSVFVLLMVFSGMALAQVASNQPAPHFTLTDINGQKHALADYKGKFVVLEWFNPGCPFVKMQYNSGNIPQLQREYTAKGVVWLMIDSSSHGKQGDLPPAELNRFVTEKNGAPTAVFKDSDGRIARLYGAKTTPHLFIINPKGTLIYQGAIDDTPSTDSSSLKTAKNYVRVALDAAMDGKPVAAATTKSYGCSIKY